MFSRDCTLSLLALVFIVCCCCLDVFIYLLYVFAIYFFITIHYETTVRRDMTRRVPVLKRTRISMDGRTDRRTHFALFMQPYQGSCSPCSRLSPPPRALTITVEQPELHCYMFCFCPLKTFGRRVLQRTHTPTEPWLITSPKVFYSEHSCSPERPSPRLSELLKRSSEVLAFVNKASLGFILFSWIWFMLESWCVDSRCVQVLSSFTC